jgi:hypothetical protein
MPLSPSPAATGRALILLVSTIILGTLPASAQGVPGAHITLVSCVDAASQWEAQDQLAMTWLATTFAPFGMSGEEIAIYYAAWRSAFGVDAPCDAATIAAGAGTTMDASQRWTTLSECLRHSVDNRHWAVLKFIEHHATAATRSRSWSEIQSTLDSSWNYTQSLARTANLRACRF